MSNVFKENAPMGGMVEPHRANTILVLGILGIVCCQPLGIAAWLMGSGDLKKMRAGMMDRSGESTTNVGYILGIIGTVLFALSLVLVAVYIVIVGLVVAGGAAMPN
jgi:hypothetical protein